MRILSSCIVALMTFLFQKKPLTKLLYMSLHFLSAKHFDSNFYILIYKMEKNEFLNDKFLTVIS